MEGPQQLGISDFTYDLPAEKIAVHPLAQRDAAKLLVYKGGDITESIFANLAEALPSEALLIFNNTRVIPARLLFAKSSGSLIEIFVLGPFSGGSIAKTLDQSGRIDYLCLVKGVSKWKNGPLLKSVFVADEEVTLTATLVEKKTDAFHIHFSWEPEHLSFAEILQAFGEMPIPPYLHRPADQDDTQRYQTIYATHDGSVAAPTAGLHFTSEVLQSLSKKNIATAYTTLHVGAGTFKPVKSETLASHEMHAEWVSIEKTLLENLMQKNTIIPVGTTCMRTLESVYWLGLKAMKNPDITLEELHISQWEVYAAESQQNIPANDSIKALLQWMEKKNMLRLVTQTQILVAPGYQFKICKGLITNFHQPQSTLLLLIAALIGEDWKKVYDYALKNEFRFLSYGDGSYLTQKD